MARTTANPRDSSRTTASPNRSSCSASPDCSSSSSAPPGRRSSSTAPDRPADLICSSLEKLHDAGRVSIPYAPRTGLVLEIKQLEELDHVPEALQFVNQMAHEVGWVLVNRAQVEVVSEHVLRLRGRQERLGDLVERILLATNAPAPSVEESLEEARARVSCRYPDARALADASAARAARAEASRFSAPGGGPDDDDDDDGSSSSSSDDDDGVIPIDFGAVPFADFVNVYAEEAFTNANADATHAFAHAARDHAQIARNVLAKCANEVLNSFTLEPRKPPSLREAFVIDDAARHLASISARRVAIRACVLRFFHQINLKLSSPVVIAEAYAGLALE